MTYIRRPLNPEAVIKTDQFIIAKRHGKEWRAVESWQAKFIAEHYMRVLKEHEGGVFRVFAAADVTLV